MSFIRVQLCFIFSMSAACNPGATNAGDASAGASGGASSDSAPDPDLPVVLYDRDDDEPSHDFGDSRPTVLTHFGSMLYWVELAEQESRIMQAPKDGSAAPRKLGTRSGYDIAKFSASERYVFWQDNGTLVAYDLKRDERRDIAQLIDDGYGGPSLAVGQDWAAFAASNCQSVATVNLKTWEVTQVKIHSESRGGVTDLTAIGASVYCANGPEIIHVKLGEGEAETIWRWHPQSSDELPQAIYSIEATHAGQLVFRLSRTNMGPSVRWSSLVLLDPAFASIKVLREFDGISSVLFGVDPEKSFVFFIESYKLANISFFDVDHSDVNNSKELPGKAFLKSDLVVDERFVYWTESVVLNDRPDAKNAIYRQRKPRSLSSRE